MLEAYTAHHSFGNGLDYQFKYCIDYNYS